MNITVAKTAGFCFGVKRAVELAQKTGAKFDDVVMLGSIIHNKDVIQKLEDLGIRTIHSVEEVKEGQRVIIRSHGEPKSVHDRLLEKKAIPVDATCPKVKSIHQIVIKAHEEGKEIVIVGAPDHPEVKATAGWCQATLIVENQDEMEEFVNMHKLDCDTPLIFVSQTTSSKKIWSTTI